MDTKFVFLPEPIDDEGQSVRIQVENMISCMKYQADTKTIEISPTKKSEVGRYVINIVLMDTT